MKGGEINASWNWLRPSQAPASKSTSWPLSPAQRCSAAAADWVPYVMLCKNPYTKSGQAFGCGQCLPCRLNRRRIWTHRIMLEASQYQDNAFITLTYENPPEHGSLVKEDLQLFLKRFRKKVYPNRIRYYCVGEYGDETNRPHYHGALFGFPTCERGGTRYVRGKDHNECANTCCAACRTINGSWGLGGILVGTLTPESAAYIGGYVTKKLTSKCDPRLNGRVPEFARMSLRPGIGGDAMHDVASVLLEYAASAGDVPSSLRHGPRILPLGRYLTRRLRTLTGREANAPAITLEKVEQELQDVREAATVSTQAAGMAKHRAQAFKSGIIQKYEGKRQRVERLERFYRKGKTL